MRHVVVWTTIENIKTDALAAELGRQTDPAVLEMHPPELTRVVCARHQMRLVVATATVIDIQAHGFAAKQGLQLATRLHSFVCSSLRVASCSRLCRRIAFDS